MGELLLSNSTNDFGGSAQIDGGVLILGADNALPPVPLTLTSAAEFDVADHAVTIASLAGAGIVYGGVQPGGHLTTGVDNSDVTFDGTIAGSLDLVKAGTGTFTLGAVNIWDGLIEVKAGTLALGVDNAISNRNYLLVDQGATFDLNGHSASIDYLVGSGTVSSPPGLSSELTTDVPDATTITTNVAITGDVSLIQAGAGSLVLNGVNTYTGETIIEAGTLAQGVDNAMPSSFLTVFAGATFDLNGHNATIGVLVESFFGSGSGTVSNSIQSVVPVTLTIGANNGGSNFDGVISGNLNLVKEGTATLNLLNAVNTYTGSTEVQAGTLAQGVDNAIPATSVLVHFGATLDLRGHKDKFGSLSGAGSVISSTTAVLSTGGNNLSTTFSGTISGPVEVIKVGTGTFTLSGANTYTGQTEVLAGTLQVTGSLSPSTTVTVAAGAKLTGTATLAHVTIEGTAGDDTFVVGPTAVTLNGTVIISTAYTTLSVNGAGGNNTLVGPDTANTWKLTGFGAGSVGKVAFSQMAILKGGAATDRFQFGAAGRVALLVDGGGGSNTLDYSTDGGAAVLVNLQTQAASRVKGGVAGGFNNIQSVVGSSALADVLIGRNLATLWQIIGGNAGLAGAVAFAGIEHLQGGTASDTFRFSPAGALSGGINGGGGGDWLDYSLFTTPVSVNLATGAASHVAGAATGKVLQIRNVAGGSSNDILVGNALGNILIGGGGNDTITGGSGRSVLIGGAGGDVIKGGSADDILIGGTTNFDSNHAALMSILSEWQRTDKTYAQRISDLKNGGGLNGTNKLIWGTTVHDDAVADTLTGNGGLDWFFANLGPGGVLDHITDRNTGGLEQVN
jgi:autotransporter-associated beta strand protein